MRTRILVMWMALVAVLAGASALIPRWRASSERAALAAADSVSWSVQTNGIDTNFARGERGRVRLAAQQPGGYRSAVVSIDGATLAALGPSGEDISDDFGVHWRHLDLLDLNAVFVLDDFNGWAVGAKGTVARLVNRKQYLTREERREDDSVVAFGSSIK